MNINKYVELLEEKVDDLEEKVVSLEIEVDNLRLEGAKLKPRFDIAVYARDGYKRKLHEIIFLIDTTEAELYVDYSKYRGGKDKVLANNLLAEWASVYRLKNKIHEIYKEYENKEQE